MDTIPGQEQAPLPGFDTIVNAPQGQMMSAGAPKTPDEAASRKAQWDQLLSDPNAKGALLRMGLNLMRGTRTGESPLGAIGRTGIDAMDYYGQKTELDRQRDVAAKKLALETKDTTSRIDARQQTTDQERQKFDEWKTGAEQRKQKADLEVQNLQRSGRLEEARIKKAEFDAQEAQAKQDFIKANPGAQQRGWLAELDKPVAELAQTRAQTAASAASTAATQQKTKQAQAEYDAMPNWIRVIPDEEARTYANAMKSSKTQSEIEADIAAGKHVGTTNKGARWGAGTAPGMEYTAQAQSILEQYDALSPQEKARYPTVDSYVTANYNVTLGKAASGVIGEVKRLQAMQGGAPAAGGAVENWVRDPKTGKLVKSP